MGNQQQLTLIANKGDASYSNGLSLPPRGEEVVMTI